MIKHIHTVLMVIVFQLVIPSLSLAQADTSRSIYIDINLDNYRLGSSVKNYKKAEKLLFDFAGGLKDHLNKDGNTVYVVGGGSDYVNFGERYDGAMGKNVQVYLSIVLNIANSNCINIQYPKFERKYFTKSAETDKSVSQEMLNEIGNAPKENLSNESKTLATWMLQSINSAQLNLCCAIDAGNNLLLRSAFVPTLVLDIQLQHIDDPPQFLKDDTLNKTTLAIATAINRFMSYSYSIGSVVGSGAKKEDDRN